MLMKGEHFAMSCFFWGPRHAAQQKPGFLSLKTGVPSTAAVFIFAARRCEVVREASEIFLCGDTVRGGIQSPPLRDKDRKFVKTFTLP